MENLKLYNKLVELQTIQHEVDSHMETWQRDKIITALSEEFHEWYNAIGFFKIWKKHKTPVEKQLDELADCLAFALSLLNDDKGFFGLDRCKTVLDRKNEQHIKLMRNEIEHGELFSKRVHNTVYKQSVGFSIELILNIAMIYYSFDELFEAYKKKSLVNIQRQKEGY
ncbi:dUTP diphosphatase [Gemella haemolysans]|uniref:dUTP diphosphatase n=1 Tax=Gemella haemolysans TaxID=1379 RepID=UPI002379C2FE|nr:dUTP diphosphatase [Gemella haemolysans]